MYQSICLNQHRVCILTLHTLLAIVLLSTHFKMNSADAACLDIPMYEEADVHILPEVNCDQKRAAHLKKRKMRTTTTRRLGQTEKWNRLAVYWGKRNVLER